MLLDVEEVFADFKGPSQQYLAQYEIYASNRINTYTVSVLRYTGKYECSCPHFLYRLKKCNGKCKHILRVIAFEEETQATRMEVA